MRKANLMSVRLVLAFLIVAWLAIAVVAISVKQTTESSFRHYVRQQSVERIGQDLVSSLEQYFVSHGSWDGVESLLPGANSDSAGRSRERRGSTIFISDVERVVVASTDSTLVGQEIPAEDDLLIALNSEGQTVGWVGQQSPGAQLLGAAEADFLNQTLDALLLAAIGAAVLALVFGTGIAWQLTRPLRTLTGAVQTVAAGDLGTQVAVKGTVEMVSLAKAFNAMSHDLAEGERLRQKMAADIAHELRTPVSVLRGHLEAMLDGVFPMDAPHLAVANDQTLHLARLVDDLRLMTLAEAGKLPLELRAIAPGDLVATAVGRFAPLAQDSNVTLTQDVASDLPTIRVDGDRLQQVMANLLSNALRHTPAEGSIEIAASAVNNAVRFAVSNTGQTLSEDMVNHVFDRFWRADTARERDAGGSGLGLAITRQLLALHHGRIWIESAENRTTFYFEIPAAS